MERLGHVFEPHPRDVVKARGFVIGELVEGLLEDYWGYFCILSYDGWEVARRELR